MSGRPSFVSCGRYMITCAKGHDATRDCRAGIVALAQELHDRPVQRLTLELVALADVDPHQYPLTL